jgi:NAD(P)-dependent dehydrogenase (short-subunit alcohol dehydrogenase family)
MTRDRRVALVTGAGRGLGRVMACALLRKGTRVVLTSRTRKELEDAIRESGVSSESALAVTADLGEVRDIERLLDVTRAQFGRVDVLVNNGALMPEHLWPDIFKTGQPAPWKIGPAIYARFLDINVLAPHVLASAVLPPMIEQGWGRIINVSTSLDTMLNLWPYGSTKAALEAYTVVLAKALDGTGVTANALLPGGLTKFEPIRDDDGKVIRAVLSPSIMEKPTVWLASDASNGVSGRRFIAALWDRTAPDHLAWQAASMPGGWTGTGQIIPTQS